MRSNVLDLSKVKPKEIGEVVNEFINSHLLNGSNAIQIITSRNNKTKHLVNKVLDNYELYSQEHILDSGILTINLT